MRTRCASALITAVLWAVGLALGPAVASAANLQVHGVAGPGGSTCGLVDGRQAAAGMTVTCGDGSGTTLNAIYINSSGTVARGTSAQAWIDAPAGLAIDDVSVNYCSNMQGGTWGGGGFWGPSAQYGSNWPAATCTSSSTGQVEDRPNGVPRYGFQLVCGQNAGCSGGYVYVPSFTISATETAQPSLTAVGTDNLWYHAGSWVWNPPSDPWNGTLSGTDITGVCKYQWGINGSSVGQSYPQNPNNWQQCPSGVAWSTSVDTDAYPNGPVTYQVSDVNAAGLTSSDSETLHIDNQAPSVSIEPVPGSSRGSRFTAAVAASAGPSGLAGLSCTDDGAPLAITAGRVSVSRNGTHRIDCAATNNAVDPQGQHNVGHAGLIVQISTSRIPVLSRRRAHGHVNVAVVIGWSWSGRSTTIRKVIVARLPRRARVQFACAGPRCPFTRLSAGRTAVGRLQRRLAGSRLRSGDTVTVTIAVPGRISERARVKIRNNRAPLVHRTS